jgi:hypothetical protein
MSYVPASPRDAACSYIHYVSGADRQKLHMPPKELKRRNAYQLMGYVIKGEISQSYGQWIRRSCVYTTIIDDKHK